MQIRANAPIIPQCTILPLTFSDNFNFQMEPSPTDSSPSDHGELSPTSAIDPPTGAQSDDYDTFMSSQIEKLIQRERERNPSLDRGDELNISIDFCKRYMVEDEQAAASEKRREEVLSRMVELKLELEQLKVSWSHLG